MQIELLSRKKWMTYVELASAMADYIVNFYNPLRRHSSIDYLTPDEFEALPSDQNPARTLITCGPINGVKVRWMASAKPRSTDPDPGRMCNDVIRLSILPWVVTPQPARTSGHRPTRSGSRSRSPSFADDWRSMRIRSEACFTGLRFTQVR